MKKILKKIVTVLLIVALVFIGIVFTYAAYDILDYYNIGADNS